MGLKRKSPGTSSICSWKAADSEGSSSFSSAYQKGKAGSSTERGQTSIASFCVPRLSHQGTLSQTCRKRREHTKELSTLGINTFLKPTPSPPEVSVCMSPQMSGSNSSIQSVSPASSGPKNKPQSTKNKKLVQVHLDCGQSEWGQIQCPLCGTLYVPGVLEDRKLHESVCQPLQHGVRWNPRKKGIIQISETIWKIPSHITSPALKAVWKQATNDLGMIQAPGSPKTLFVYVRNNRVLGLVAVEPRDWAYRVSDREHATGIVNTQDRQRVLIGIAVLWTHQKARNRGIATSLVTATRKHTLYGSSMIPKSKVAFSSPTQAGWIFAKKYAQDDHVLVYKY